MEKAEIQKPLEEQISDMKRDWDWRARENARWFINTYKLDQTEEEFDETGRRDLHRFILNDLDLLTDGRNPKSLRVLEIGCGIGRITKHLAGLFGEVHGTDVSGEMIRQGRERLHSSPNLFLHETNGADFSDFLSEYFDLIFSTFVFQHLPSSELVISNITDAFRLLKPGGVFKFLTNGITNAAFAQMPKDTWTGVAFDEAKLRLLSSTIGAQLIEITGGGTQYCCPLLRKPNPTSSLLQKASPRVVACSNLRASAVEVARLDGTGDYLTLIVAGVDRQQVDVNNVVIELRGRPSPPFYVGRVREALRSDLIDSDLQNVAQINVSFPKDEPGGWAGLRVTLADNVASDPIELELPEPQLVTPTIHQVTNVFDGGLDICASGPKSLIRLFVQNLWEADEEEGEVRLLVDDRELIPEKIVFLPNNAAWEVTAQFPEDTLPGQRRLTVIRGEISSPSVFIEIL
jgi:ubiquinone/menaquinone biosynthesis C-methylase UbiE